MPWKMFKALFSYPILWVYLEDKLPEGIAGSVHLFLIEICQIAAKQLYSWHSTSNAYTPLA